jgi:SAM-dependent methyltransferase
MLKSRLRRGAKLVRGLYYSYVKKRKPYNPDTYWDEEFYSTGVSDAKTLAAADLYAESITDYHYASIELLLHKLCIEDKYSFRDKTVLDVGAGSGHWVEFYLRNGAKKVTAIDLSKKSCDAISKRFEGQPVEVHNCAAGDVQGQFDLINAVGIMFHITDDALWTSTVSHLEKATREKLIVGGAFGAFTTNYQWNNRREATKRLRSLSRWKNTLESSVRVIRNPAFAHVEQSLPHSNLLIASKNR